MIINFKKLTETAKTPYYGSQDAAMCDLYADIAEDILIPPHSSKMIGTGIAMQIPKQYWGGIFPRSGIASKKHLRPSNCVGVIDPDYRGELLISLQNDSYETQIIKPYERIAQFTLLPKYNLQFNQVQNLSDTVRGDGGFGSTGSK